MHKKNKKNCVLVCPVLSVCFLSVNRYHHHFPEVVEEQLLQCAVMSVFGHICFLVCPTVTTTTSYHGSFPSFMWDAKGKI